jgi:peptide/nickel transport system permease protein
VQEEIRKPSYYVKKRLFGNMPAMVGAGFIVLCSLLAFLGYLVMPDSTPSANDGAVQIQKRTPGFKTLVLKKKRNVQVDQRNILVKMFLGQESEYTILPILSYKIIGNEVEYLPEGRVQIKERVPLSEIVEVENGDTQADLVKKFEENHLENRTYFLGTDKAGRDMLSRLLFGTRISLGIGLVAVFISLLLGISIGAMGGFFGGRTDQFIMWLMTVVWSIPGIMLVIAISLALQSKGIWVAFVAVGLTTWVEIARVVRGQIMSLKEKTFVEAGRALGINNFQIIFKHILPNLMGPIIVIATSNFASAILTEAGLSFLGLGVQPPMPSWGMMVNEGFHSIGTQNSWHLILFPSLAISLLVLAFNLFGNGLRDAYDPQVASKW